MAQASFASRGPQSTPASAQSAAVGAMGQLQTFGTPPPPQTWKSEQAPHCSTRATPQLSVFDTLPQLAPAAWHSWARLICVQPQPLMAPPPPQVSGAVQVPGHCAVRTRLHPSIALRTPHSAPRAAHSSASVVSVQGTQTPGRPVFPQVVAPVQVPQVSNAPQPSKTRSQFLPCAAHVVGTQPRRPASGPGGTSHAPHSRIWPQPSCARPQTIWSEAQELATQASAGGLAGFWQAIPVTRPASRKARLSG